VGLHPFGRFEGKSAMEMGADAIQAALADASIDWKDIQFGVGGSHEVSNPDAVTRLASIFRADELVSVGVAVWRVDG